MYTFTRPEHQLLLLCARAGGELIHYGEIKELSMAVSDWGFLTRTASFHGVMPLIYRQLSQLAAPAVPTVTLQELEDGYLKNAAFSLHLAGELLRLLELLADHGVPALPYKGPVLAATAYQDLTLRQAGDLDILVRKTDVMKVWKLLGALDYKAMAKRPRLRCSRRRYHLKLHRRRDGVRLELHWQIKEPYFTRLKVEQLLTRARCVTLAGKEVCTLAPDDLVLVLSIHGSRHLWSRLGWVCDVARSIQASPQLNWMTMVSKAEASGHKGMLLLGLVMARDLLYTDIPAKVDLEVERRPEVKLLAKALQQRLFKASYPSPTLREGLPYFLPMLDHRHHTALLRANLMLNHLLSRR